MADRGWNVLERRRIVQVMKNLRRVVRKRRRDLKRRLFRSEKSDDVGLRVLPLRVHVAGLHRPTPLNLHHPQIAARLQSGIIANPIFQLRSYQPPNLPNPKSLLRVKKWWMTSRTLTSMKRPGQRHYILVVYNVTGQRNDAIGLDRVVGASRVEWRKSVGIRINMIQGRC